MKLLACILLLASSQRLELLDETSTIAAGAWNFYPSMRLRQLPVAVRADYTVLSEKGEVRLALLTHEDTQRLFKETPHGVLAATEPSRQGSLHFRVPHPDDYDIVLDNRDGKKDVTVRVRVALELGEQGPVVVTATPARQFSVVLASFLFFFGIVTYSARKILRAIGYGGRPPRA
jgi:hypothetical protein